MAKFGMRAVVLTLLFFWYSFQVRATHPMHRAFSTFEDFQKGKFKGVSLTSDGRLVPAPALEELFDTGEAFIYAAVADSSGAIYVGTGSNGKIYRVDPSGTASEWAKLPESGVYALAMDSAGRIFAGTSPDGKVYRLSPQGESQVFFEPPDKYIWSLAVDSKNNLYVGTGPKGMIYRLTPQGSEDLFFDSSETHIVSLNWDLEGNLLAGSAPEALLLRISPQGKAFVLYDSPLSEMKSILIDRYGNIYASALSGGTAQVAPQGTPDASSASGQADSSVESKVEIPAAENPKGRRLEVYRVDRDNLVETLYASTRESAYAQLIRSDGTLLLATGDQGRILSVSPQKFVTILVQTPEEQVTQLVERGGSVYALTSNLGKVFRLSRRRPDQAVYESDVLDAGILSDWGVLRWTGSGGAGVRFYTRSGNTGNPDATWSDWSSFYDDPQGSRIVSPPARYLQWKVEFSSESRPEALVTSENAVELVDVTYLQRNRAPQVSSLTVHAPGVAFAQFPQANPAGGVTPGGPDGAHLRSLPREIRELEGPRISPPPRKVYVPGARSFSWEAGDPNDDDLTFSLYYRRQEESDWRLAVTGLQEKQYTLDGVSFPDGIYFVKVVASDLPGNPSGQALEHELVSKAFVISNSAPHLEWETPLLKEKGAEFRFKAVTRASVLYQAEYSVDGGPWNILFPADGIADSSEESFSFQVGNLEPGMHSVRVRVVDSVGNISTSSSRTEIP